MSFNPLGVWQPLYRLIYASLLYGYFYCAQLCLQHETLITAIWVKRVFMFTWQFWRAFLLHLK